MRHIAFILVAVLLVGDGKATPLDLSQYKWCCVTVAEFQKCLSLRERHNFLMRCHQELSTQACALSIQRGESHMMFLDGGDIFRYRSFLHVVAAEDYGEGDASYYAVAVAKSNLPSSVDMHNLFGMRSCHTGVGKTSGWNTPMGWIARNVGEFDSDGRLILQDPFIASCAPGAHDPEYKNVIPNSENSKWCELCIGDVTGKHVCERDNDEQYYGYSGAFRCLQDGAGDVAFVKHKTVPDSKNYVLLCPDGSRKSPSEWRECNLARVPAHGLVMKDGVSSTVAARVHQYMEIFRKSAGKFAMFGDHRDLLWKSSTENFLPMFQEASEYLGKEYYCNMLALHGESMRRLKMCFQ